MFNIKIENFEGPLDLLLYFIKRDKIDIYDIPITQITNEYISVIDDAKKLDVSIAGEFLFMAINKNSPAIETSNFFASSITEMYSLVIWVIGMS